MEITDYQQVYEAGNCQTTNALCFRFDAPQTSHGRLTVVLRDVSRKCQFGVMVCDENRCRVGLQSFDFFQVSVSGTEWFQLTEQKGKIHKLFVGPPIAHVKMAVFCFRPGTVLQGKSLYFRIVSFERGHAKCHADSKALLVLKPAALQAMQSRSRFVNLQGNGRWEVQEKAEEKAESITSSDSIIAIDDGFDDGFDDILNSIAEDLDFDILMMPDGQAEADRQDAKTKELQERVLQLEEELKEAKAKCFQASNRDESKRCDKCYDVVSFPYYRSVFWVHQKRCFEKFHCQHCESKPKELRRKLVNWYWKDEGAHSPQHYSDRVAFTVVNRVGECQHRTLEDLSVEFDKCFYVYD